MSDIAYDVSKDHIWVLCWRIDSRRARGPEERPVRRLLPQFNWEVVEAGSWEEVVAMVKSG